MTTWRIFCWWTTTTTLWMMKMMICFWRQELKKTASLVSWRIRSEISHQTTQSWSLLGTTVNRLSTCKHRRRSATKTTSHRMLEMTKKVRKQIWLWEGHNNISVELMHNSTTVKKKKSSKESRPISIRPRPFTMGACRSYPKRSQCGCMTQPLLWALSSDSATPSHLVPLRLRLTRPRS